MTPIWQRMAQSLEYLETSAARVAVELIDADLEARIDACWERINVCKGNIASRL